MPEVSTIATTTAAAPFTTTNQEPETEYLTSTQVTTKDLTTIQITPGNVASNELCSPNSSTGLIIGVAVGAFFFGSLTTMLAALLIVAVRRVVKRDKNSVTLVAVNPMTMEMKDKQGEMNDVEMAEYSYILTNPGARLQDRIEMMENECYATSNGVHITAL